MRHRNDVEGGHPDMHIPQLLQRERGRVECLSQHRILLCQLSYRELYGAKIGEIGPVLSGHILPHPFHEAGVCLLIILRWWRIASLRSRVIDVQKGVESMHDGALSGRRSTEIQLLCLWNSLVDPIRDVRAA